MALDHLLKEARKARLADDYASAFRLTRAFLDVNPGSPEAESLLGLCEIETGRSEGEARILQAAEAAPGNAAVLLNLSILRERQGDLRRAVASANAAASADPQSFEAWAQLGKLLGKGEKFPEAFAALEQAMKIRADHPGVVLLFATAALETGRLTVCAEAIEAARALGVPSRDLRRLTAHLLRKRGDAAALEALAKEWLEAAPADDEARIALSYALAEQGYYDRAAAAFAPIAAAADAGADKLAAMGRYLLGGRRLDEAASWFQRALKANAADIDANFGLARRAMFLGRLEEAEAWCRRTISAAPAHAEAYGLLAEATGGRLSDADIDALERALATATADDDRIKLLFARGDALHARKDHAAAFDAWSEANRLKRSRAVAVGAGYDRRRQAERTQAVIRRFSAPKAEADEAAPDGPTPIFIVGMPRSGTTLLESALCAHPKVDGAGEVPAMPFFLDQFLAAGGEAAANRSLFAQWRAGYLDQCRRFGWKGAPFVTDKQPSNIFSVGLAARLFPSARFIHIRRNPVETGFSIFRRHFTQAWPFTTDLADIAHYYAEHSRVAEHWADACRDRFTFVQYEALVEDFEGCLRRLVAFCGLGWSDECLRFHEKDRAVLTFSAAQVREGPTAARLSSAGPYMSRLAPLIEALEALGVDLETGALRRPDDDS
ncbi:MAG: sulfotransferase [Parvularculaceae bacterium]